MPSNSSPTIFQNRTKAITCFTDHSFPQKWTNFLFAATWNQLGAELAEVQGRPSCISQSMIFTWNTSCFHTILFFEPNITTLVNNGVKCPDICAPLTVMRIWFQQSFPCKPVQQKHVVIQPPIYLDLLYIPVQFTFLTYEFSSFIITQYCGSLKSGSSYTITATAISFTSPHCSTSASHVTDTL